MLEYARYLLYEIKKWLRNETGADKEIARCALIDSRDQESFEPFREFMMEEHIRNICKEIEEYKKSQEDDPIKVNSDPIKPSSDPIKERLYQAVLQDGTLNYAEYAAIVGTSEATVKRRLGELKKEGAIIRVGSNKTGHWENNKVT